MSEPTHRMRTFVALWLAELLSLTGSAMTGFALGVWVYRTTGSATQFAAIVLVLYLPQVLVTVVSGALADRYSRRRLMLLANSGAAAVVILLAVIVAAEALSTAVVYGVTFLVSVCSAIQYPAFASSVPQLVPERHLGRANGMVQMANASSRMLAPATAALLLPFIDIVGIVLVNLLTLAGMITTLALITIPQPHAAGPASPGAGRVLRDVGAGWSYIIRSPGLLRLLGFFSTANVAAGFTMALLPPLVLDFATDRDLGLVLSIEGLGWLLGAIVMIAWGGPKRRIHGVLVAGMVFGLGIMVLGVRALVPMIAAGVFVYAVCLPVINACNATIWQTKVPAEMLGRALATLRMVALASVPVSAIVAGVLADSVFKPLFGANRGIAWTLILSGLLPVVAGVAAYLSRPVREVEREPAASVAEPARPVTGPAEASAGTGH